MEEHFCIADDDNNIYIYYYTFLDIQTILFGVYYLNMNRKNNINNYDINVYINITTNNFIFSSFSSSLFSSSFSSFPAFPTYPCSISFPSYVLPPLTFSNSSSPFSFSTHSLIFFFKTRNSLKTLQKIKIKRNKIMRERERW